ncbi:uncharacterized protein LOC125077427 [Vanessa atalanta]|uniref:uncharacterized protein LOC125077427 n=1 Tax=Vanessa atalanta TaxID=42275 RepID=UPI001FCD1F6C|nr:uncharacterized protein LOC125077427 [Vanessa atalanta]
MDLDGGASNGNSAPLSDVALSWAFDNLCRVPGAGACAVRRARSHTQRSRRSPVRDASATLSQRRRSVPRTVRLCVLLTRGYRPTSRANLSRRRNNQFKFKSPGGGQQSYKTLREGGAGEFKLIDTKTTKNPCMNADGSV